MRVIHCIQHSERVRPLAIAQWASERDLDLNVVRIDKTALPKIGEVTDLIVLGGQMNTDEVKDNPWINTERDFLKQLIDTSNTRIFGICLGSQLIAEALGSKVHHAKQKEIGWHRASKTDEAQHSKIFAGLANELSVFEWHGDTWDLPDGAELMLEGYDCKNQAFEYGGGRIVGVQFHPEFTYDRTRELADTTDDDLEAGGSVQSASSFLSDPQLFDDNQVLLYHLLDKMFDIK